MNLEEKSALAPFHQAHRPIIRKFKEINIKFNLQWNTNKMTKKKQEMEKQNMSAEISKLTLNNELFAQLLKDKELESDILNENLKLIENKCNVLISERDTENTENRHKKDMEINNIAKAYEISNILTEGISNLNININKRIQENQAKNKDDEEVEEELLKVQGECCILLEEKKSLELEIVDLESQFRDITARCEEIRNCEWEDVRERVVESKKEEVEEVEGLIRQFVELYK